MSIARKLFNTYWKLLLDTATITGPHAQKTDSKKIIHTATETTGEFIGKKIAHKIVKPDKNSRKVQKIIIPPEKQKKY